MPRARTPEEANPDYMLTVKMLNEFRTEWNRQFGESGIDAVKFSRLSVVALSQIAAIVAVDVGMTPDQFSAVCSANFNTAYERAPKFG